MQANLSNIPAIEGFSTTAQARVVLLQSGKLVHAPADAIGLQPLDPTLTALAGLDATAGIVAQTDADQFARRIITGTANKVTVANGDGAAGNPTLTIPDAVTLVTPTITGLLTLSGGRLAFPAAQVSSADPNTLDDYQEGVWTPTIAFGGASVGIAYGTRAANFTKIGRLVMAQFDITLTNQGSATGAASVAGFPFNAAGVLPSGTLSYYANMASIGGAIGIRMQLGTGNGLLVQSSGAVNIGNVTNVHFTNTSRIIGSISYTTVS